MSLGTTEKLNNRIRYTGQQYDDVTGQYYLRARYYNPVAGRFMQEDVYQGDGLNLYAYCGNNPVVYDDPSGYASTSTGKACPPKGKISESVDESGATSERKVPNPNGKKGCRAHQDTIASIQPSKEGGEMVYEMRFDTSNGSKSHRYADAVEIVDGNIVGIHQAGKVNNNGTPVIRESRAIEDIMNSPDYNGAPDKVYIMV